MGGLRRLQEHGVEFNVLTTVHAANAEHPLEVYRFLRDELGSRFIQFIPIVERLPTPRIDVPLESLGLSAGMARGRRAAMATARSTARRAPGHRPLGDARRSAAVPDRRLRRVGPARRGRGVRADVRRGARVVGRRAGVDVHLRRDVRRRAGARAQRRPLLVRPLRRAGAPARQHRGHADGGARGLAAAARLRARQARHAARVTAGRATCASRATASARRTASSTTPDGEPGLNYLCAGYKAFFHHVDRPMRIMADLLRRGLPPSDIVQVYAQRDAAAREAAHRLGRNDACPCGSGRKVKHCHGAGA